MTEPKRQQFIEVVRNNVQVDVTVYSVDRPFDQLVAGQVNSVREIASRDQIDEGDVSRMLGFAFLAPDIVIGVARGQQPIELTGERLKRLGALPRSWSQQRHALGFSLRE